MNAAQASGLLELLLVAEAGGDRGPAVAVRADLRAEDDGEYGVALVSDRSDVRFPNPLYLAEDGQLFYWSEQRQERIDVARLEWGCIRSGDQAASGRSSPMPTGERIRPGSGLRWLSRESERGDGRNGK
jgi:hypothetical protein